MATPYAPKTTRLQQKVARFCGLRDRGMPLTDVARVMGLSARTAQRYETSRKART